MQMPTSEGRDEGKAEVGAGGGREELDGARGRGDGDRGAESSLEIYGRLLWSSD